MVNTNNNSNSGAVSRGSLFPVSRGGGSSSSSTSSCFSCNRCNKSLTTTLFVCACDCVFCEECTYEHFEKSHECPSCHKTLGVNDFLELVIADPSAQNGTKTAFQTLFTKYSTKSTVVTHHEMSARIISHLEDQKRAVQFLLKQLVQETATKGQTSGHLDRHVQQLQAQLVQLKQAHNAQRLAHDETVQDLQNRVQALQSTITQQHEKLAAQQTQLAQFRQLVVANTNTNTNPSGGVGGVPMSSSGSVSSSGGKRGRSSSTQPQQQQPNHQPPPMQGFVQQRQARELARQQELDDLTRSRNPLTRSSLSTPMVTTTTGHATVGQPPPSGVIPPSSRTMHHPRGMMMMNQQQQQQQHGMPGGADSSAGPLLPPTPRIRDFTTRGYRFTVGSSSSNHSGGGGSGFGGGFGSSRMGQQQQQPSSSTNNTTSPSMAFAYNRSARNNNNNNNNSNYHHHQPNSLPASRSSFSMGYGGRR